VKLHWIPILGYEPEVFNLSRGWFGFKFHTSDDTSKILERLWYFDEGRLMLK
jgi:hypothetical protein